METETIVVAPPGNQAGVRSSILWLEEALCRDVSLVGAKAANLSRLATHGAVPSGFCVTGTAFDLATASGSPSAETEHPASLIPGLDSEVVGAYRMLGERCGVASPAVAVRSSAMDEDGGDASFAGQHETYLNVVGAHAVLEAVRRCSASALSSRALEYRRGRGLDRDEIRAAVLVQRMVPADVSAVAFTMDPVTGSREEVVIDASWGLGESIVGGTVTPDTYRVRRAGLAVAAVEISEKRRMTVGTAQGTLEVDVPRFLRCQPALSEEQAVEVARLGIALEAEMGRPVDVECAYRAGRLYLLQCRPITAVIAGFAG